MIGAVAAAPRGACATLGVVTDVSPSPASPDAAAPFLSADDLVTLTRGRLLLRADRPVRGAAIDSRTITPGQLFVALPGERTDGHRFVAEAAAAGAAAVLVSRPPDDATLAALRLSGATSVVLVADSLRALQAVAAGWRRRFAPIVVGVTGSIAKTSTKEAIAAVLARRFATLRSEGNQNNEIGLPLTLLGLRPEHEAAVLEMGMYVGGEIADLARIARPRIGVVTAVQAVHLSRIGSIEAIEQAKGELVEALPADGTAILNADDERVRRMAGRTAAAVTTYGFAIDADVTAERVSSAGLDGMRFDLVMGPTGRPGRRGRTPVAIPGLGRMSVHNALAAAAVGQTVGLSPDEIGAGLAAGWSAPHRAAVVRAAGVTIVDDSYNASPGSVIAALDLLAGLPGRRIAVLGEMLELGEEHVPGHEAVGMAAAGVCDLLVVVGEGASAIVDGARRGGLAGDRLSVAADRQAAVEILVPRLRAGDVVLVKASRGVGLDLLVDDLRSAFGDESGP